MGGSESFDLERRCADLEELLARERTARRIAQEQAKANAAALHVVAREVRAPLEGALEWARMLRRELLSASGRDHALRVVERQIDGSMRLIDDLVASAATTLPRPARIQLDEAVLAASVAVAPRIQARKLSCVLDLKPFEIVADAARTERLLRRLFETASDLAVESTEIRVTLAAGSLVCALHTPPDLPDLPPADWDAVASPDGISQPLHVGLFLLRRLAEAHGARIELRREQGARLILTFAADAEDAPHSGTAHEHALRSPLQVLSIGMELLRTRVRDSADDLPREWVLERLTSLDQAVDHLTAAVERLSAGERAAPAESPSEAPQP